jgi:hypothetical protein
MSVVILPAHLRRIQTLPQADADFFNPMEYVEPRNDTSDAPPCGRNILPGLEET